MKGYKARNVISANLGILGLFKPVWTPYLFQKKENDKVSWSGIFKFECGTVKIHYKDKHNDILDKHHKKSPKGVFLYP